MTEPLRQSSQKIQDELDQYGYALKVMEMQELTRTAQEAANTIGCEVGQIVKSLIFKGKKTDQPVLVVASGVNRVNEKRIKEHLGEAIGKANADYVLEHVGYVIGGVPPIGHKEPMACFIDEDLFSYTSIWAAAGTPYSVFELTPDQLLAMTQGKVITVK